MMSIIFLNWIYIFISNKNRECQKNIKKENQRRIVFIM